MPNYICTNCSSCSSSDCNGCSDFNCNCNSNSGSSSGNITGGNSSCGCCCNNTANQCGSCNSCNICNSCNTCNSCELRQLCKLHRYGLGNTDRIHRHRYPTYNHNLIPTPRINGGLFREFIFIPKLTPLKMPYDTFSGIIGLLLFFRFDLFLRDIRFL